MHLHSNDEIVEFKNGFENDFLEQNQKTKTIEGIADFSNLMFFFFNFILFIEHVVNIDHFIKSILNMLKQMVLNFTKGGHLQFNIQKNEKI